MIKTSALLVVLAIGLLVAGVFASSLLMVYVSIGVCAVAALLLAVGVLTHWPEIFGRSEPRPSGVQASWPASQVQVSAPVLASAQATGTQVMGVQVKGAQTASGQAPGIPAREERRSRRGAAAAPSSARPAEVVTPEVELAVPGPGDELWERVEEELGSAGKRDTGALSWPATEIPVLREPAGGPEQPASPGAPPAGSSAWIWGQGAGWQPPDTPDQAWPPPAAAFAGSPASERATDADGSEGPARTWTARTRRLASPSPRRPPDPPGPLTKLAPGLWTTRSLSRLRKPRPRSGIPGTSGPGGSSRSGTLRRRGPCRTGPAPRPRPVRRLRPGPRPRRSPHPGNPPWMSRLLLRSLRLRSLRLRSLRPRSLRPRSPQAAGACG